jgi:hypothetical protein
MIVRYEIRALLKATGNNKECDSMLWSGMTEAAAQRALKRLMGKHRSLYSDWRIVEVQS